MTLSMAKVVSGFKRNWTEVLSDGSIRGICQEIGYRWRERILDPVKTIQLFLLQILHGNTAMTHLPHLARESFTAAGYCLARARLPLRVFELLLERLGIKLKQEELPHASWRGHRTFFADGSSFSMPDSAELRQHFGQPKNQRAGCGFPVCRFVALFHAGTGMILKVLTGEVYTHDMAKAGALQPELQPNDVLVADRGLCSFAHFCWLLAHGLHAVIRLHASQGLSFSANQERRINSQTGLPKTRRLRLLGVKDQLIEWFKPHAVPLAPWLTLEERRKLPNSIIVRQLQYHVAEQGFRTRRIVLVTTLLDRTHYPVAALAELYRTRWSTETNFRHLKITLGMDVLHSTTVEGVLKELSIFCIVYNLVCLVIGHVAARQQIDPDRISFVDALRWLASASPHDPPPLALVLIPLRPNRVQPRVRKRRPKPYKLMSKPRSLLLKELYSRKLAA